MKKNNYVIVRSAQAGVHAGYLISREDNTVTLKNARRMWCWVVKKMTGDLASLSELAVYGVKSRDPRSRIAVEVPKITILGACEIIHASPDAQKSIENA